MTHASKFSRSLLLALPLTLCGTLALAAPPAQEPTQQQTQALRSDLQRVEVSGHRPRLDVRAACPRADQVIQESLASVLAREGEAGLSTVKFKLKGDRITEVSTSGGPNSYRQAVRSAVRQLDCTGSAEEQTFSFQIKFTPFGQESDSSYRVALLTQ